MRIYLTTYKKMDDEIYNPRGSDQLTRWSSIDLTPSASDAVGQKGEVLVATDGPLGQGALEIGEGDGREKVTAPSRRAIGNRLGINLEEAPSLGSLLADILLRHAREDGTRWRRLRARRRDGLLRLRLGSILWERPAPTAMALVTDNFNRADGALGDNWDGFWSGGKTRLDVKNNQAREMAALTTSGSFGVRHITPMDTDDHYAQIVNTQSDPTTNSNRGPVVRKHATLLTLDYYLGRIVPINVDGALTKYIAGTATNLLNDNDYVHPATPFTHRVEVDGSELSMTINGGDELAVTDTSIVGNLYVGLRENFHDAEASDATKVFLDDFEAGDIVVPPAITAIAPPVGAQVI